MCVASPPPMHMPRPIHYRSSKLLSDIIHCALNSATEMSNHHHDVGQPMQTALAAAAAANRRMLSSLASLLEDLCNKNHCDSEAAGADVESDAQPGVPRVLTTFHSVAVPSISIRAYLHRIRRYSSCSDTCFILGLIYMDFAHWRAGLVVDALNVHRLFITCVLLAMKYLDDRVNTNATFAEIGGVSMAEMNSLEIDLLKLLSFNLDVPPELFQYYEEALMTRRTPAAAAGAIAHPPAPSASDPDRECESIDESDVAVTRTIRPTPIATAASASTSVRVTSPSPMACSPCPRHVHARQLVPYSLQSSPDSHSDVDSSHSVSATSDSTESDDSCDTSMQYQWD